MIKDLGKPTRADRIGDIVIAGIIMCFGLFVAGLFFSACLSGKWVGVDAVLGIAAAIACLLISGWGAAEHLRG